MLGVPSEYSIPGLTLTLLNINSIMLDYGSSREVLEVLQGILVFMVFVLLSRFCAIGYSIAGFVMTLKKKSIAETHLIGASGRSLCLAILVALITLFLNGILADSGNEYFDVATAALNLTYISPAFWVWITGIVAGVGLYCVIASQKKETSAKALIILRRLAI